MTTAAQLRKSAMAQQGAEQRDVGGRSWVVEGRSFAGLEPDGRAALTLAEEPAARMAAELDGVKVTADGVIVDLAAVNGMALNFWVHEAWKHRAPASLGATASDAARAAADEDDDFGPIGAPARRALHDAGIADLDTLARRSRPDVAGLHGIGPKAFAVLAEQLQRRGVDW